MNFFPFVFSFAWLYTLVQLMQLFVHGHETDFIVEQSPRGEDRTTISSKGELCSHDKEVHQWKSCRRSMNILVVSQGPLVPSQRGCDKRSYYVIDALVRLGHDVYLAGLQSSLVQKEDDRRLLKQLDITIVPKPFMRAVDIAREYGYVRHISRFKWLSHFSSSFKAT